jgi:hypothetical protein
LWWWQEVWVEEEIPEPRRKPAKKPAAPIDPRLKRLARELRDRWTEETAHQLPAPAKYDVRRAMAGPVMSIDAAAALGLTANRALPKAA